MERFLTARSLRAIVRALAPAMLVVLLSSPAISHSQGIVWVHDGQDLPQHRLRGQVRAETDLKAGVSKLYVSVCTFPMPDKKHIRSYEIRKALYKAVHVLVMADLCNDLIPNASQQNAFVTGYNGVMEAAIGKRLGPAWKAPIEKQVAMELRKHPEGTLQAGDIASDTPY